MKIIQQVGMKFKLNKYEFHTQEKKYLRFIFNLKGVPVDLIMTKAILPVENPKNSETYSMFHWVL